MTRKSKARYGMNRTYKLNAAVKALRSALFAGMAMAAVAPAAQAACTVVDNTITCTGAFGSTLNFGPGDVALPFDMTTIQLDAGTDIDVIGNFGVNAFSFMDMTLTNDGSVNVYNEAGFAVGILAQSQYGDVAVINNGSISATSYFGEVVGIVALSAYGDASASNDFFINTYSVYGDAYGMYVASPYGEVNASTSVDSSTTAQSVFGDAVGIQAQSFAGDVSVDSAGAITALSTYGDATGISAYSVYGAVDVSSSGYVRAETSYGSAIGVSAISIFDDASVASSGEIHATSNEGLATGIYAVSIYGDATVYNEGSIHAQVTGNGSATGIFAYSYYGDVGVTGSGNIAAIALYGNATGINAVSGSYSGPVSVDVSGDINASTYVGNATGINAYSYAGDIDVTSAGAIDVTSTYGNAIGIKTGRFGYSVIDNSGNISADTYVGNAIGIQADSFYGSYITNSGDINAETTYGSARGIQALTTFDVTVVNSGDLTATSYANGSAQGIRAKSSNGYASVTNSGDISATSTYANAIALLATGQYGVEVINTGDLSANSAYNVYGIYAQSRFGDAYVSNAGDISANATYLPGQGIYAKAGYDAVIVNSGDISVSSDFAVAYGTYAYGQFGVAAIFNSGDVNTSAYYDATGLFAKSLYDVAYINNSGDVSVSSDYGVAAYGLYASAFQSTAVILNYGGDISADGGYDADASALVAVALDDVVIYNSGDLNAYAYNGDAIGLVGATTNGNVAIYNIGGDISAESVNANAYGIYARSTYGDIEVVSTGDMNIDGYGLAIGIYATADGNISVYNSGEMTVSGQYAGVGIAAISQAGDVEVLNAGNMAVDSYFYAVGIVAGAGYGDAYVANSGDFIITAVGPAIGIQADAEFDADVFNLGDISVYSEQSYAGGILSESDAGDAYVASQGNITATGATYAGGILALAQYGTATVFNSGDISVYAPQGSFGIRAEAEYDVFVANSGSITATAVYGSSTGIDANSYYGDVTDYNFGDMVVSSTYGEAIGISADADNGSVYVSNSGDLQVSTQSTSTYVGYYYYAAAGATGIQAFGDLDVTVFNSGALTVSADDGTAAGIDAAAGYVSVSNAGSIMATTSGEGAFSVGIRTESGYTTSITNSGTIDAAGDNAWAIVTYAEGTTITNSATGKIFGAIWTTAWSNTEDSLTNDGKWYVGDNNGTYFGGGDDSIVNNATGKIFMDDSYISMGYSEGSTNSFLNNGKLYANGDNYIDMGGNGSVFTNNGSSIHMDDADVSDTLTIYGDFAGTGHIVVNADGSSLLADRLYIEGDVVTNTANIIDVKLLSGPSIADMLAGETIEIVHVSGTSAAANFNIGIVTPPFDELYTVESSLIKDINYSGTNDLFSLGFEISGLSTAGVVASSVAPGVQNLWNQGTGTLFQREGTHREFNQNPDGSGKAEYKAAAGVWVRGFTSSGSASPDAHRDNFGAGGSNNFDMDGSGIEFGVGYAFNSQWTAGLLGGTSESTVDPDDGGRADIDADTLGAYVTYTPGNGFYADFSYRAMDFDGYGQGGQTEFGFEGSADGYSLEMGYGYKMSSGLIVEPQFQYSSVDVDLDTIGYNMSDFELTDGDSSLLRIGAALRKSYKTAGGNYWTPYGALSWLNETDGSNSYEIGGLLTGGVDTGGGSALFEAGVTGFIGNFGISAGMNWRDGSAYDSVLGGQLSVRYDW